MAMNILGRFNSITSVSKIRSTLERWRLAIIAPFPERHIYIRTAGEIKGVVLTTQNQLLFVIGSGAILIWAVTTTIGMLFETFNANANSERADRTRVSYERLLANRDARLINTVDTLAKTRADRLRTTLRLAGVNPDAVGKPGPVNKAEGGPFIAPGDPQALAGMLSVNDLFAEHIQQAAMDVYTVRALAAATSALPLSKPTRNTAESSGFGVRPDPFTGRPAFHSGLDFPAPPMTSVYSTAPGVILFTGARVGYGSTIEIDHGGGFRTRFAHLAAIYVKVGQHVGGHERIGGVGSTGRSTGPHLHYEVWRDGRPQDPERFLKAGEYVQQAG
jgi:murein DD-endopeptidase MepM/ murein hydrolase activator NlpD